MRDVQLLEMTNYVCQSGQAQPYLEGGQRREDVGLEAAQLVTAPDELLQFVIVREQLETTET